MKKPYPFITAFIMLCSAVFATGHSVIPTVMNNVTCPGGSDGKAYVTVSGGVGPFTYLWNSGPIQTTDTLLNASAGIYTCQVTDQNDMSVTTATVAIQNGVGIVTTAVPACAGGTVTMSASGGTTYSWAGPNGFTATGPTASIVGATAINSGTYTVQSTSSSGCTAPATVTVNVFGIPAVNVTNYMQGCGLGCDASVTVSAIGGTPPYTYSWSGGGFSTQPAITNLCPGTYTIMVTDGNGCSGTNTVNVFPVAPVMATVTSQTDPSSCNTWDGEITVMGTGGAGFYNFLLTGAIGPISGAGSMFTFNSLIGGNYYVQVVDNFGCSAFINSVTLTSGITATSTVIPDTCGQSVGMATIHAANTSGPVSYNWQPGNYTTQSIASAAAGIYTVTVSDTACTTTTTVVIANHGAPTVVATSNASTCGNANGLLSLSSSGGVAPHMYSINGGAFSPNQTYNSMAAGIYTIVCQDANGCQSTITHTIQNNGLLLAFSTNMSTCNNNDATATVNPMNGTGPYTYAWSNGAITSTIIGLGPGTYSCVVTDNTGCSSSGSVTTVTMPTLFANWSSSYNNCGINTLDATAQTGTGPFTYLWAPGGQTTPVINNLPTGSYTCTVTDQSSGCTGVGMYYVYNYNASMISGNVYADLNGNCSLDLGENAVMPLTINAISAAGTLGTAIVNPNGYYQLYVPTGAFTYTLVLNNTSWYNYASPVTMSCGTNTVTLGAACDTLMNVNIGYVPAPGQDLQVVHYCGVARPGFPRSYSISYANPGSLTTAATVKMEIDPLLTFTGSTPPPSTVNGNSLEWNLGSLTHGQSGTITVMTAVPTIQAGGTLGTLLHDTVWIEPISGDIQPVNNSSSCYTTIIGSYDPNFKEAWAENMDATGAIDTSATELFYTVHFQNTGTDTAFNIVVRDTISNLLDLSTLELIGASHPYTVSIEPMRTLQVRFNNILLVDSFQNEPLSHGWFQYKIRTNGSLNVGEQIDNTAGIYFDFNLPIITNTVETPVQLNTIGIKNTKTQLNALVFPNPSNTGSFTIRINDASYKQLHFTMYNASGQKVADRQLPSQPTHQISTSGLGSGIYFYQLINAEGKKMNGKIVLTD